MEFEANELRKKAIDRVLGRERAAASDGDGKQGAYASLFAEFGVVARGMNDVTVLSMLNDLLVKAASFAGGLDAVEFCPKFLSPAKIARKLYVAYEEAYEYALDVQASGKSTQRIEEAQAACAWSMEMLNPLIDHADATLDDLVRVLPALGTLHGGTFGKKDELGKDKVHAVSEALDWAVRNVNAMLAAPHAETLLSLAKEVEAEYQQMLDEACALDNNGLLHRTLALLEESPAVARQYQGRFKLVMVDEFQDTNRLQVALIEKVAGVENLCTVGDAQQSIYRFNGADVSVFEEQREKVRSAVDMGSPALMANLDANFRSHGDILAFVRHVCGRDWVFGKDFLDLKAGREEKGLFKGEGPRIELQVLSYEDSKDASGIVEAEAAYIAERFDALRSRGHRAGEMVILMGKTSNVDVYADALRARNFECVVGGGRSFFELPEVQVVRNVLTVLANPGDSEALFSALTSPLIHLSADDFVVLGTCEGNGGLVRRGIHKALLEDADGEFSEPLQFALSLFERALTRVKRDLPSRILLDLMLESGWLARLEQDGAQGTAVAANIFKALRMVEELESKPGYAIARVARDFREMAKNMGEAPASLSVANQDAVRLMTVHKSKGLEFPIVAVASYEPWERASETFSMTAKGESIYVALSAKESKVVANGGKKIANGYAGSSYLDPSFADDPAEFASAVRGYDWQQEGAEAQRKFYVACTRASEYLLISGLLPASSKKGELTYSYARTPILHDVKCGVLGLAGEFPEDSCLLTSRDEKGPVSIRLTRAHHSAAFPFEGIVGEEKADEGALDGEESAGNGGGGADVAEEQKRVLIVPASKPTSPLMSASVSSRAGVFSYSAIAPHEDHLPVEEHDDLSLADPHVRQTPFMESDEGVSFLASGDQPSATDVGSAFHRIGQLAVVRTQATGGLVIPDAEAVDAIARSYRIQGDVRKRLDCALDRWFASDIAREVQGFARLRAEVPFMVPVPFGAYGETGGQSRGVSEADGLGDEVRFLEGEIDLLAESEDGAYALVVDYKTGGSQDESAARLQAKHSLQARCYAYALLSSQGYRQVDFAFVRVEREDAAHAGQPQVVRYSFSLGDLDVLRQEIVKAYLLAKADA